MFDTFNTHRGPDNIHVHHTEKRAATDESVRLLKEMEAEALKKLLSITRLEGNTLKAAWHVFQDNSSDTMVAICRFELNGQEHKLEVPINRRMHYNTEQIAREMLKCVADELSRILLTQCFQENASIMRTSLMR